MAEEVKPGELDITDELIAERRAEEPGRNSRRHDPLATSDHRDSIDVHQQLGRTADLPAAGAL